jgi:hypothetical protein
LNLFDLIRAAATTHLVDRSASQHNFRIFVAGAGTPGQAVRRHRRRQGGQFKARTDGTRALFIDFDGVLHPTTTGLDVSNAAIVRTPLFGWLPVLAQALKPHPDVALVISSTWRYTHSLEELRDMLDDLGPRVIGATPRGARYESILAWLSLNPNVVSHRILDDDPREFPNPAPAELILSRGSTGISAPDVLQVLTAWLES